MIRKSFYRSLESFDLILRSEYFPSRIEQCIICQSFSKILLASWYCLLYFFFLFITAVGPFDAICIFFMYNCKFFFKLYSKYFSMDRPAKTLAVHFSSLGIHTEARPLWLTSRATPGLICP